jgi:hypothetical protein
MVVAKTGCWWASSILVLEKICRPNFSGRVQTGLILPTKFPALTSRSGAPHFERVPYKTVYPRSITEQLFQKIPWRNNQEIVDATFMVAGIEQSWSSRTL